MLMFIFHFIQVSADAGWHEGEMEASCALGLLYESLGQPQLAMQCHERCLQLASALGRTNDASAAAEQLVQVRPVHAPSAASTGCCVAIRATKTLCHDTHTHNYTHVTNAGVRPAG